MLFPDPDHLHDPYMYVDIDHQRPFIPLNKEAVIVPHFPEAGDTVCCCVFVAPSGMKYSGCVSVVRLHNRSISGHPYRTYICTVQCMHVCTCMCVHVDMYHYWLGFQEVPSFLVCFDDPECQGILGYPETLGASALLV